ncbi:DUF1284 domain-containing protein [Pseudomonadota bacterium]
MANKRLYKVRIHHLLCMQGFQGYGYNEEFVKNMSEVVDFVKDNSNESIEIVARCDSICSLCPHQKKFQKNEDICLKDSKEEYIEKILKEKKLAKFLNLELNKQYKIKPLFEIVNSKICSKKIADKYYCKDCQWQSVCLWYKSRS